MTPQKLEPLQEMADFLGRQGIEARFDPVTKILYSTDASNHQVVPLGVGFPRHRDEVSAIVAKAAELGLPVLPRGAGTSLGGQAVGPFLILDTSRYLKRIGAVDRDSEKAIVEPGVVCQQLNHTVRPLGLKYGPDPASADRATFGGMIGNNATGAHSVQFGMTADHLLRASVVVGDGSLATFETVDEEEALRRSAGSSLEAGIYRAALQLRRSTPDSIRARWPQTWRRSSGYGLNYLVGYSPDEPASWYRSPEPYLEGSGLGLPGLLAGSEGTLGVLVEAEVRLVRRPAATSLLLLAFETVPEACAATVALLETRPAAIELIPAAILTRAKTIPAYARKLGFLEAVPRALLAVEFEGNTPAEAAAKAARAGIQGTLLEDAQHQADFWEVRKAGLGLLMSVPGDAKPSTFMEDVSVPVAYLAEYVRRVDSILADIGTTGEWYAHASAGCLHMRPMVNLKSEAGRDQMRRIADAIVDEVRRLGGAVSGEHGDGLSHTEYNEGLFGPELTEAFREVKRAFDPKGILNPGKVVALEDAPAAGIDRDLRYGRGLPARRERPSVFAFQREQGFLRAVEDCSGVGVCRKDGGVMCPSFQATRDEKDSTRGRANALRAAMSGWLPETMLFRPEMHAVLDLCLECKGCRAECPTGVDMARIKAEYLYQYQKVNGVPWRSRLLGRPSQIQRRLRPAAPIHNVLRKSAAFRGLLQAFLGIDRRRVLPAVQARTFRETLGPLTAAVRTQSDTAILFVDTFTDLNEPEVGAAAVRLLRAAGVSVGRAPGQVCCGRPMISKGLLEEARQHARTNIAALAPYAEAGISILGLEPSCLMTLRDEYLEFFPDDPRARAVAGATRLLEEFLLEEESQGGRRLDRIAWKKDASAAIVHNHCHVKSLVGSGPILEMLGRVSDVRETTAGCCGMAGSFGYEAEHYPLSLEIAEMKLFPEVRSAVERGEVPVAAGFSCRTQVRDGLGIEALHPVEFLAARLADP